jgi:uncharacterized protein YhfF
MADIDSLPVAEFAFPGPLRDALVSAIGAGRKTATTSLRVEYENEPLPRVGERHRVIDSGGATACVIEITDVYVSALGDVDDAHAVAEGEGHADVAAWRAGHERFWRSDEMADTLAGLTIDDSTLVVLERFRVV